ncbi:hypothetical protein D0Y50_14455 [Salinimonas sediminis]|uniref:Uncharacterized protein n=1 Tax=Salinimonas sediminis TaxID=2303538 RepID=A0A346NPJ0_9ALTE|nr:hypothetical protein D0Y50_14455 [Salinimonas sediminis]
MDGRYDVLLLPVVFALAWWRLAPTPVAMTNVAVHPKMMGINTRLTNLLPITGRERFSFDGKKH